MTFPEQPDVMLLLLALLTGQKLDADGGALTLEVPGVPEPVAIPSLPDALDALEARHWVRIEEAGPYVTDQGRYAVKLWLKRRGVTPENFALSMRAARV